jgi:hypothetical protein
MGAWGIDETQTIALLGISGYFSILNARVLWRYVRFRGMRQAPLLTWPAPRSAVHNLGIAVGVLSTVVAGIGLVLHAGLLSLSQGLTALYFLGALPLLTSIRSGLYAGGIWLETTFVPYEDIARWALPNSQELVLLIVRRRHPRGLRLTVPPDEYAAVHKLLLQKAHEHRLQTDPQILNLSPR